MSDEHQCAPSDDTDSISDPLLEPLMHALVQSPMMHRGTPDQAGRRFLQALRGRRMRQHFDEAHPDQLDRALEVAPPDEGDREAWLFGFRFEGRAG